MKKMLLALLSLSLVMVLVLPTVAETKEITYVTLGNTGMELLEEAAKAFEEKEGVKVNLESWSYSDAYSKILTLAEAGNMPDSMYGFSSWTVQFKEADIRGYR